jgi:hypothetical protein
VLGVRRFVDATALAEVLGVERGWVYEHAAERNDAAVQHGAYGVLALGPRAAVIADWLRRCGDHLTAQDEPAVETLGLLLAQAERAAGVLGEVDEVVKRGDGDAVDEWLGRLEARGRLSQDSRRWIDSARRLLHELGLTPSGRVELQQQLHLHVHVSELRPAFEAITSWALEAAVLLRRSGDREAAERLHQSLDQTLAQLATVAQAEQPALPPASVGEAEA